MVALHAKYLRGTDLATFLALPQALQLELVNAAAFSTMPSAEGQGVGLSKPTAIGGIGGKKRKVSTSNDSDGASKKLSSWLARSNNS